MNLLRSILFALVFYGWTVVAVLISFPVSLLGTRALRGWAHLWVGFHRWCARWLLGVRTRIEGARSHRRRIRRSGYNIHSTKDRTVEIDGATSTSGSGSSQNSSAGRSSRYNKNAECRMQN